MCCVADAHGSYCTYTKSFKFTSMQYQIHLFNGKIQFHSFIIKHYSRKKSCVNVTSGLWKMLDVI